MRTAARQHFSAQRVAGSGKRLQRPSDDPVDIQRSMLVRAAKADLDIARDKAAEVNDELLMEDQTLGGMEDAGSRLREISVQMSNDIMTPAARLSASIEVADIKSTLIRLGNTQFAGKHLFGGQQIGSDPFDSAGTYLGDATAISVNVGNGLTVDTTISGGDLLRGASGGPDILQEIDNMATALGTNFVAGINASIDAMDLSLGHISEERARVGSRMNVTEGFDGHLADIQVTLIKDLSDMEDADILAAFSELTRAKQGYESAMQVSVASQTQNIFQLI
jgi:flagellar hook-associated protein 3 FlgL